MIVVIQRVSEASVRVSGKVVGQVEQGLLVLLAIEPEDSYTKAKRLAERVANYRVFEDHQGKMNLSVKDSGGDILVVSQFTLAADTSKGLRPSFSKAAAPEMSKELYQYFCQELRSYGFSVPTGIFGADMKVALINDGPVTFRLTI